MLRLQVLSTRLSLFLPMYAICMMLSLRFPVALQALTFPVAITEGASFYSFFALFVTNMGGPEGYIKAVTQLDSELPRFWSQNAIIKMLCNYVACCDRLANMLLISL